ncbi:MAG: alkaline phosphatase family protein [Pseudomonadota bacterium]
MVDVEEFRTEDKDRLLRDLRLMASGRFRAAGELITRYPWHFFMMVEIATDRLHHGFWRYSNRDHPLYEADNPRKDVIRDFYGHIDGLIGSFLARLGDDAVVMVMSDHGAKSMLGGVSINEWLIRRGFLALKARPETETYLTPDMIDWSRTKAWSDGGYYARIFLNVQGREPSGIVDPSDYHRVRDELAEELAVIREDGNRPSVNRVIRPEELYRACKEVPPDLIVYFDDLNRRAVGTVGTDSIFRSDNDKGPDDANHDPEGVFTCTRLSDLRNGIVDGREVKGLSLLDITPTILSHFGVSVPSDLAGRVIGPEGLTEHGDQRAAFGAPGAPSVSAPERGPVGYTEEEEEIIKKRLEELGYL